MANRPVHLPQDHMCKVDVEHTGADPLDYVLPKLVTYYLVIPCVHKQGYQIERAIARMGIVPIDHAADFSVVYENVGGIEIDMD